MFLLLQKNIRNLVTRLFIADYYKLPRLAVSARRSSSSAIKDLANKFIRNVSALVVTANASAAYRELVKFLNLQHDILQ
jgi:hypothetical protein